MKYLSVIFSFLFLYSCAMLPKYEKVKITPIFVKENIGIRALEIENQQVYFAGRKGWIGKFDMEHSILKTHQIDSALAFRSLAVNNGKVVISNILSPAKIFSGYDFLELKSQMIDAHEKAFYDALEMNNHGFGIIMGDPTETCLSVQITKDNGETWSKIPCNTFPKSAEGEAAFAASDTNIKMIENNIWIASGGKSSRIYKSEDSGKTWQVYETPIIQGKVTTGMYSMDFYNEKMGIAIGGDYTKPDDNTQNIIKTTDGGKNWKILNHPTHPSYRSCIQFVPNSKGKSVVTVGFQGVDVSHDGGETWRHISDQSIYSIRFFNKKTAFAGGKNGVYRLDFY